MSDVTPPGWYQDPEGPATIRWWDGTQWAAPLPVPVARTMWPWSTAISPRTYLALWIGAVTLLEALGVVLARLGVGFGWFASVAAAAPGPIVLIGLGAIGWSLRPK